jgi:glutaredoxin 3
MDRRVPMSRVTLYTKAKCPFSQQARVFLDEKGVPYEDVDITDDPELKAEMVEASAGDDTTPQVFIDGEHIGGFDELVEEDRQGHLAATLASGLDRPHFG